MAKNHGARVKPGPGPILDPGGQFLVGLVLRTGGLLGGNDALIDQRLRHLAHELDPGNDRADVVAAGVIALVEVFEVDVGWIAWIGRAQAHVAGGIVGVSLEDGPGEVIEILREERRVAGEMVVPANWCG